MSQNAAFGAPDHGGEKWFRIWLWIVLAAIALPLGAVVVDRVETAIGRAVSSSVSPPAAAPAGTPLTAEAIDETVSSLLPVTLVVSAPAEVKAFDATGAVTSEDNAHAWVVEYATPEGDRRFSVSMAYSLSDVEGNPAKCSDGQSLDCSRVLSEGEVAIVSVVPVKKDPDDPDAWLAVPGSRTVPGELWWQRTVELQRGGTFVVHVRERIKARSRVAAQRKWAVSEAQMLRIAKNPRLVFPSGTG